MKTVKRLLSLFLVMAMVFSCLPTSVFSAESQVGSGAVQEALQNVEALALTEETVAQLSVQEEEFQFVEPGKENDAPVGDVIITDSAYRIQLNPDLSSYTILEYMGSAANVVIPSEYNGLPITRIGAYAFQGKTRITTVSIPETVTRMEEGVFEGCKRLSYHVYEGGKYLGSPNNPYYYYCGPENTSLTEAAMHEDTKLVASFAFRGCENLKSVVVPDGVIQVGYGMLFGCDVESVTLPFVGEMGTAHNGQFGWAFGARSMGGNISYVPLSLKNVVITGGATIIQGAFYGVDMLESITLPYLGGSIGSTSNTFLTYYWGADAYTENILPSSIHTAVVSGGPLGQGAFYGCAGLQHIVLGQQITSVNYSAFSNCSNLSRLTVPYAGVSPDGSRTLNWSSSLANVSRPLTVIVAGGEAVGPGAFQSCNKLEGVVLAEGIVSIGASAFQNCDVLVDVQLPESLRTIGDKAFASCNKLEQIVFPEGLTDIQGNGFFECIALRQVNIPASVQAIGNAAFSYCSALTQLTVPANVQTVGISAFAYCTALEQVSIADGVTDIGESAFRGCTALTQVTLPSTIKNIEFRLFNGCTSLTHITIPEGVESIKDYAFLDCSSLKSVELPTSLNYIMQDAFLNCGYYTDESKWDNGLLYIDDVLISAKTTIAGSYVLRESTRIIANYAFKDCVSLTEITLPEGLRYMGMGAFVRCTGLTKISFPNTLQSISASAFAGCTGLTEISIPKGVKAIEGYAFNGCTGLTSVVIPGNVTTLEAYAFSDCTGLTQVSMQEGLETIGGGAFSNCTGLTSIQIPNSVQSMGTQIFNGCTNLETLQLPFVGASTDPKEIQNTNFGYIFAGAYNNTLPDSLKTVILTGDTRIPNDAFEGCTGLTQIRITGNVNAIFYDAFAGCTGLTELVIPDSVQYIGTNILQGCTNLQMLTVPFIGESNGDCDKLGYFFNGNSNVPGSLTTLTVTKAFQIAAGACEGVTGLVQIRLPDSIYAVGEKAFYNTGYYNDENNWQDGVLYVGKHLVAAKSTVSGSLVVKDGTLSIADKAFYSCTGITDISIPDTVQGIGYNVFTQTAYYKNSANWTNGILYIGNHLIAANSSTNGAVTVRPGVITIAAQAFSGASITQIDLPDTLKSIGNGAFSYQRKLTAVTLQEGLQYIGDQAFNDCSVLQSITIPGSVDYIGYYAFVYCDMLSQVKMADSDLLVIGSYAFRACESLTEITIPEGVAYLGYAALGDCDALQTVTLPGSIRYLAPFFLNGSRAVETIYFGGTYRQWLYAMNGSSIGATVHCADDVSVTELTRTAVQKMAALSVTKALALVNGEASSGLAYTSNGDGTCYVSGIGTCTDTVIVIPDQNEAGETVTAIGNRAFYNNKTITSVTIPDTVTTINTYAFYGCNKLTEASVPDSVTTIGSYAFYSCASLTQIDYPKDLTSIASYCYYACTALTEIRIPDTVTTINSNAFTGCTGVTSLTMGDQVTSVGASAFYNCSSLSQIQLSDGIRTLGNNAFGGTAYYKDTNNWINNILYVGNCLVSVKTAIEGVCVIREGTVLIPDSAFSSCTKLTEVVIPTSVRYIGSKAFYQCTALTKMTIPFVGRSEDATGTAANFWSIFVLGSSSVSGVPSSLKEIVITGTGNTVIPSGAFTGCKTLTSLTVGEGVAQIKSGAFTSCSNIASISIADTVRIGESFSSTAFYSNSSNWTGNALYIGKQLLKLKASHDGGFVIQDGTVSISPSAFSNCYRMTSVTIPESVTYIGQYAFSRCDALTQVSLPSGVAVLEDYTFNQCIRLTDVDLKNVESIGQNAFYGCTAMTRITLPQNVKSVGYRAFYGCTALTEVTLSDRTEMIGDSAFYGCKKLTTVRLGKGLRQISASAFYNCNALDYVYIDDMDDWCLISFSGSYSNPLYYGAKLYVNGQELKQIVIPEGTTEISNYAFYGLAQITKVTIPESVVSIGNYAFASCYGLTEVDLPVGLQTIGENAFTYCRGLQSVTVPGSVQSIGSGAFSRCTGLQTVVLEDGLTAVGASMFTGCSAITQLQLPTSVKTIGKSAFSGCAGLTELTLCENVTVEDSGFANCSGLSRIAISKGVSLGVNAFSGCTGLTEVDLTMVRQLSGKVFNGCSGITAVKYDGEYNAWRHVLKASDWDEGMADYSLSFLPDSGLYYETDDAFTEFYISALDDAVTDATAPECYSGRPVVAVLSKAFGGNRTMRSISLPESVVYIGESAFANCTALERISFPRSLQYMQRGVLAGCDSLETLELPYLGQSRSHADTAYIGYTFGAYSYRENEIYVPTSLETIRLTDVDSIEAYAFYDCIGLQTVQMPDGVTSVGSYAFSGCSDLTAIALPDSVTKIGEMIFDGCNALTAITIGAGLTYQGIADLTNGNPLFGIDKSASRLKTYHVAEDNPDFTVISNILYRKMTIDGEAVPVEIVDAPAQANLRNYELPDLVVKIGAYAFAYNNTLRGMDLEYVRMIGNNAFYKAENLVYANFGTGSEELPAGVDAISYDQYVGDQAFMGCGSLQTVNLDSEMLIGIGEDAFADCDALTSIELGKNIQSLGIGAFGSSGSGGSNLEEFRVDPDNSHLESIDGVLYQENSDGTLTLLVYPAMSYAYTEEDGKSVFHVPTDRVTGIESYAFRMSQNLDTIYVQPDNPLRVGDYAFTNSKLERVYIGENVTSLGLKRGEGEYTVFSECDYLVAVEVEAGNSYYSSESGVLFDKNQTKLIKYPAAKAGTVYKVPDTVSMIASMAFKDNTRVRYVHLVSQVHTVGLEAFYGCTNLALIFFDGVYAPTAVLENAFTTYDSVNQGHMANPRTKLGYSEGYYLDGEGYGWKNYEDVYDLTLCQALPETENRSGNDFYAVVVVDSEGRRLDQVHVTLTDPNGNSETVATGSDGAAVGTAMFFDLFEATGMGFAVAFDGTYSLKVTDPEGEYFTYVNPAFYLDQDMRITYVTLTQLPSIYGTTCGEVDINTEGAEINKAEYGYTNVELIDESLGFVEGNIGKTEQVKEYVDISVIAYCDSRSGWAFTDDKGQLLDAAGGLYQNGVKISDVTDMQVQEDTVLFTFHTDVSKLMPEVEIEARLTAFGTGDATYTCSTILNIHVFDFIVTEDDVQLDAQELEVDLAAENQTLAKLFGSPTLNVSLGKDLSFGVSVDGSRVEMTLGYEKSKSKDKGAEKRYASYQEGYESNHHGSTGNTYEFEFYGVYVDEDYQDHLLKYIVRIARGTEKSNYFYYRCYVYEGEYKNEVAEFYGVVNGLSDNVAKLVGAKTYKERVAPKAALIYLTHLAYANKEADELKDIKDLESEAKYVEAREEQSVTSNSHSLDVELQGKLIFEYDKETGLTPVSSEIHGELYYTFKHNSQFVVWVIPVVLQVEVKVGGEVDITLKFDENRKISMDEAKLTVSAAISAKVGVGCSVASVGVYGSIGTVFVLDFYPEFGVDSWTLNGEIGAYMRILWYTKKFSIAKFNNVQLVSVQSEDLARVSDTVSALYLAENYSSEDLGACDGNARIVALGEEIYKVFYVDASGLAGYDSYNYQKLAVAKWNGTDWDQPAMVDDNGLNDARYALYSTGDQTYMVYTQQGKRLDAVSADDTYVSSANMTVKIACITDPANITVSSVADGANYKYLPTLTETESGLMAVWAENADNNMFGVSPYNYIDANGQSHVFETTANSIYASTLTDGQWQTPVCLSTGLSAVTDLAAAADGSVCYIVDGNGDLGDDTDRVLWHLGADGETAAVNSTGSVTGVEAADGVFTYYLSGEQSSGLRQLDPRGGKTQVLPDIDNLTDNYKLLYDESGAAVAVFYTAVKTWQEADTTVDGSAMYGVFCNDGQWGQPVEISAFPAESDVYISFFDALYRAEDQVMLMADFVDRDGNMLYSLTEEAYTLTSSLSVVDHEMDYVNQILDITVTNSGARPAAVYISLDGGEPVVYGEPVGSGATADISVSLADCGLQPVVQVFADSSGSPVATISDLDLNYSDVIPLVKQLLLGKENRLLVAVKNTGNLDNSGYLLVRGGNYDARSLDPEGLLAPVDTAALVTGEAVSVQDAQGVPFWVVKYQAVSGGIQYVEIPLTDEAFVGTEDLITLYTTVDQDTEKGQAADNNITYASYQALTGVLTEGETVAVVPELQTRWVEYDGQDSVNIPFTCGSEDTVQSVALNGDAVTDYTVQCQNGTGTLTVPGQAFENLVAGEYTLTVSFTEKVCTTTVSVPRYYTVTWVSEGQTVCTTQVKHGDIPYISSVPTKEDSRDTRYAFVGWSPDGSTVGTQAVTADTTYYALWGEDAKVYTVTWVLCGTNGATVKVSESYAYNTVPGYTGTLPTPTGKVFTGWDQDLAPVTADAVYTARYAGLALYENGEQKTGYTSLTQIMASYDPASQYIRLTEDAQIDLVLTQKLYIDLAGFDLTGQLVTNGFKVYGMDSTTDGYSTDNMGCFSCVDAEGNAVIPETRFKTDITGSVKRYMAIQTDNGYTFHRFYLGITSLSLQPDVTGFGYKAEFYGDAMVQGQLASIGYSLWLTEDVVVSRSTDQFKNVLTLRLKNFDVASYGQTPVNATVTMTLTDGTVIESAVSSHSMRDVVEAVNADFDSYETAQKQAVKAMCEKYAAMSDWDISKILTWTEET